MGASGEGEGEAAAGCRDIYGDRGRGTGGARVGEAGEGEEEAREGWKKEGDCERQILNEVVVQKSERLPPADAVRTSRDVHVGGASRTVVMVPAARSWICYSVMAAAVVGLIAVIAYARFAG